MRWLVTGSRIGGTRTCRYVGWLVAGGVDCIVADAAHPEPDGAGACDALLLSGGGDIEPGRYGRPLLCTLADPDPARDRMELDWIRRFRDAGKPVFGICRGLQLLHVALGGALIQHVPDMPALAHEPHGTGDDDVVHGIRWTAGTRLAVACGSATEVNSHHHQAADPAHPATGLRVAAVSPAGVVEALESADGPPVSAVQWHPERLPGPHDPARDALLRHWVSIAQNGE